MPTTRHRMTRPRRSDGLRLLSEAQRMELLIGPRESGSAFESEAARKSAWLANRDELLPGRVGRRPFAWWRYESPATREPERDAAKLIEMGCVGDEELAAIHAQWRRRLTSLTAFVDGCLMEPQRSVTYWAERRGSGIPDTFARDSTFVFHEDDDDDEDDER